MELLLDTHTFLWWLAGDDGLSAGAKAAIADESNDIFVSAASMWEIATKHRIGKLSGVAAIAGNLVKTVTDQGFIGLPISLLHAQTAGRLPGPHHNPFDRMLVAQATLENFILVSNELLFDGYDVQRLW